MNLASGTESGQHGASVREGAAYSFTEPSQYPSVITQCPSSVGLQFYGYLCICVPLDLCDWVTMAASAAPLIFSL